MYSYCIRDVMNCVAAKCGFVRVIIRKFTRIGKILIRYDEICVHKTREKQQV